MATRRPSDLVRQQREQSTDHLLLPAQLHRREPGVASPRSPSASCATTARVIYLNGVEVVRSNMPTGTIELHHAGDDRDRRRGRERLAAGADRSVAARDRHQRHRRRDPPAVADQHATSASISSCAAHRRAGAGAHRARLMSPANHGVSNNSRGDLHARRSSARRRSRERDAVRRRPAADRRPSAGRRRSRTRRSRPIRRRSPTARRVAQRRRPDSARARADEVSDAHRRRRGSGAGGLRSSRPRRCS